MTERLQLPLDAALEDCRQRVESGEAVSSCLLDYAPALRDELARLVPIAVTLARLGKDPTPSFQASLEGRLLAAADERRPSRRAGAASARGRSSVRISAVLRESLNARWTRSPRRAGGFRGPQPPDSAGLARWFAPAPALRFTAAAAVVLAVLVGGGVGAVVASEQSLPDSPLYQVKEARESAQLILVRDPEDRVAVHLQQISERGGELRRAVRLAKDPEVFELIAARLSRSAERIVDQALETRSRGNPRPAVRAGAILGRVQQQTARLLAEVAPEAQAPLLQLRAHLTAQEQRLDQGAVAP